jgi:putative nucleotidyltransferase with HDIG domain
MSKAVKVYVGCVVAAAAVLLATLFRAYPSVDAHALSAVFLLASLALVSETLGYLLPRSATGSISFIPYLACVLIVPGWETVLVSAAIKGVVEVFARRHPVKAVFNVAQNGVSQASAVWVYLAFGGKALSTLPNPASLLDVTQRVGFQALMAMLVALMLNGLLVSGAIALSGQTTVRQALKDNKKATAGVDVLSGPLTFVFAWLYAGFGPIAAATLWVPVLGLRQVHKTNLELEQTNQELLELMVKSLEARDAYTSGHSRRVHHYSTIIARAIGLSEREVEHIGRAALLHDVGKIHDKYAPILSKMDKLTADEWQLMKQHPDDGANLVATMTRLRDVVPAIRYHHENWDGTGYPQGLAGEMIPIAARIIRFADTIDAMTTDRPYRRPLGESVVRGEIVRCRGTQFDPNIADALLSSQLWFTLFPPQAGEDGISTSKRNTPPRRGLLRVVG